MESGRASGRDQRFTQLAEPSPRVRIHRLRQWLRRLIHVEVAAGDIPRKALPHQLDYRSAAVFRLALWLDTDLAHHRGVEKRSGVEAVDREAGELLRQIEGQHDEGELALAVGLPAVVLPLQQGIAEVDRRLSDRRDIDDGAPGQPAPQELA